MAFYLLEEHEYRYKPQGGVFTEWITCAVKPIPVGDINISVGDFQVRVKASGSRPAGVVLSNDSSFTMKEVVITAPANGEADSLANMGYFTPAPGTTASDYEQEYSAL